MKDQGTPTQNLSDTAATVRDSKTRTITENKVTTDTAATVLDRKARTITENEETTDTAATVRDYEARTITENKEITDNRLAATPDLSLATIAANLDTTQETVGQEEQTRLPHQTVIDRATETTCHAPVAGIVDKCTGIATALSGTVAVEEAIDRQHAPTSAVTDPTRTISMMLGRDNGQATDPQQDRDTATPTSPETSASTAILRK
jgi:hypothetical protein